MQSFRVLGCSKGWISACQYLRLLGPLRVGGGELQTDLSDLEKAVADCDLVFFTRQFPADEPNKYERIVALARAAGKSIIYETDDLLIDLPKEHPEWRHYSGFKYRYVTALLEADSVLVTNDKLKEAVQHYNENVVVMPNYLDDSMWSFVDAQKTGKPRTVGEPLTIGYMGTVTHSRDLQSIEPALVSLLTQYDGGVRLKLWGVEPVGRLKENKFVEHVSNCPGEYNLFVPFFGKQSADIFIAPLTSSRFNNCKSFLKYLEYSTLGVPGVYSRGSQYDQVISDGVNGFLAGNLLEWHKHLTALIENESLRKTVGTNALNDVRAKWLLSAHGEEINAIFRNAIANKRSSLPDERLVRLAKEAAEWAAELAVEGNIEQESASGSDLQEGITDEYHRREMEKMKQRVLRLRAELSASQRHASGMEHLVTNLTQSWAWRVGKVVTGPARNLRQAIGKRKGKPIEIARHV